MRYINIFIILFLCTTVFAHDYLPGTPQNHPIMLTGGDLYTVSGDILVSTDILFEDGRITQIGINLTPPPECEVIDITGQHVYPGLIAPGTSLGLTEIGAVRATNDVQEVGQITPEVKTHIAYNPDSELLPTVRANGITTVQVVPSGSLLRGRSCILNLDGWTKEDAAVKLVDGLHLSWPTVKVNSAWRETRTIEQQKKDIAKNQEQLKKSFDDARAYYKAKEVDPNLKIDLRWEAMLPVFTRELPVFVYADDYRQIEQALNFAKEQKIRIIIMGAREAWKLTDLLVENNIPVIYGILYSTPYRQDDSYESSFTVPKILHDAGVKFCLSSFKSWRTRNLPFEAAQAVSFGLNHKDALRAVTLSSAEILGLSDELGSLEVGKKASIIVSKGDILDHMTHSVTRMFIEGRKIDLNSKHKELFEKYKDKSYIREK